MNKNVIIVKISEKCFVETKTILVEVNFRLWKTVLLLMRLEQKRATATDVTFSVNLTVEAAFQVKLFRLFRRRLRRFIVTFLRQTKWQIL